MRLFYTENINKNQSYTGRKLLFSAVYSVYSIVQPKIERTHAGKPFFPDYPDIHFSISHSKNFVICALSDNDVGVDVQFERRVSPLLEKRVCDQSELSVASFFSLWSLKESYIKLIGQKNKSYQEILFSLYDEEEKIFKTKDNIYGKLYFDLPGYSCAVCSGSNDFPEIVEYLNI